VDLVAKPKGRGTTREIRSQHAQLERHQHGTEKGVKWPQAVKDGSREDSGPTSDTKLKGKNIDPKLYEIQQLLTTDRNLSGYGLKAGYANNTLQITGIVDTLADKQQLKSLLAAAGIQKFTDGVSISTDGQVLDNHVALEVEEELQGEPNLAGTCISVECMGGTVFLVGRVENHRQEEAALAAARRARGVVDAVSQLRFLPDDMDLESVFHSQVRNEGTTPPWKE